MNLGIYYFYLVKKVKGVEFKIVKPDLRVLISERHDLEQNWNKGIQRINTTEELPTYHKGTQVSIC